MRVRISKNIRFELILITVWMLFAASSACADEWPQWRGPKRDGVSSEKGLLQSWGANGPELIQTISDIGKGCSSPIIAGGKIFISGHVDQNQILFCFSLDGKKLWQFNNGPFRSARFGAQGSALVDGGLVYILSEVGRLAAIDFTTGRELWKRSLSDFKAPLPKFKYADSLLVHKNMLICQPGGAEAAVAGLDKKTGKTIWKSSGLDDTMAYCSGIVANIQGVDQFLSLSDIGLISIDVSNGKLLWRYDSPFGKARNSLTPIVWREKVFADSGRKGAHAIVEIRKEGHALKAVPLMRSKKEKSHLGGFAVRQSRIYGHNGDGWICIDLENAKVLHFNKEITNGSTIYADNRFYSLSDRGVMYLIEADEKASRIMSRFTIPNAGQQTWARPAISDGRLYLRRADKIFVYAIR